MPRKAKHAIKINLSIPGKVLLTLAIAGFFVFGGVFGLAIFCVPEARAEGIMISEDTVWEKGEVRVVDDPMNGLAIMPGVKLTINPGVIIKLGKNTPILAMGELDIKGSETEPVIITSLKNDTVGGDTNGDGTATAPMPGDWYGIMANGPDSKINIDYAEISYGGGYEDMTVTLIAAFQISGFNIAHSSFIHDAGVIFINEVPDPKINYSNIYLEEDYCREEEGERICEHLSLFFLGSEPLDAINNYWGHAEGPSLEGAEDAKGIFISGNVNYEPFLTEPWEPEVDDVLDPVIIVPGIMGSWNVSGRWQIDPIFHTYDNLMEALIAAGYKEDSLLEPEPNLFTFSYNWRNDNNATAGLLREKIEEVKNLTGADKVDLVAHSMGGLIARSYIQGSDYQNDVDQLVFLGTPHLGSLESYLKYEGGDGFFSTGEKLTKYLFQIEAATQGYLNLTDYIRAEVLSVEQLLPVFNYLKDKQPDNSWQSRPYPLNYPQNNFLENLNSQSGVDLLKERVNITNIVSDLGSESTLNYLRVVPDPDPGDNKWQSGYPENLESSLDSLEKGNGDSTVPLLSADSLSGVEIIETNNSDHENLPTIMQKEIIKVLTGKTPDNYFNSKITSTIKKWFFFRVYSPVDFVIIAPDGRKIGKDINNNAEINEISDAFYSGFSGEAEFVLIPNPEDGEYKVSVQGVDNGGQYKLSASLINDEKESDKEFSGTITANQIQEFNLNYAEEAEDPISELDGTRR